MLGGHAGPIDTDMASGLTLPKVTPADVVRQVLAALEAGRDEALVAPREAQRLAGVIRRSHHKSCRRAISMAPARLLTPSLWNTLFR